jgi:hypothetical protein
VLHFIPMDRRTKKGWRSLNVWVPPELGKQLDEARGLIPMQRYVVHVLEQEMERLKEGE